MKKIKRLCTKHGEQFKNLWPNPKYIHEKISQMRKKPAFYSDQWAVTIEQELNFLEDCVPLLKKYLKKTIRKNKKIIQQRQIQ